MMTLKQIASLGKELAKFLVLFVGYFRSQPGFALGRVYVQGLLSNVARKNAEAIAMEFNKPPRTLQRFLESVLAAARSTAGSFSGKDLHEVAMQGWAIATLGETMSQVHNGQGRVT